MASEREFPPGLDGRLRYFTSGGDDVAWLPPLPIKYYTVAHIIQNNKVKMDRIMIGMIIEKIHCSSFSDIRNEVSDRECMFVYSSPHRTIIDFT